MEISEVFLKVRKRLGLTQTNLAEKLEVTQTHLSQIESGKKDPSIDLLRKLSTISDLPIAILMWFSIELSDVPYEKKEAFKILKPSIDNLIGEFFTKTN